MRNVTVTLDEAVARWARIQAAKKDTSVSRLLGELLREKMREERNYERAMREYLAEKPRNLSGGAKYPKREDLYDRKVLRRH